MISVSNQQYRRATVFQNVFKGTMCAKEAYFFRRKVEKLGISRNLLEGSKVRLCFEGMKDLEIFEGLPYMSLKDARDTLISMKLVVQSAVITARSLEKRDEGIEELEQIDALMYEVEEELTNHNNTIKILNFLDATIKQEGGI